MVLESSGWFKNKLVVDRVVAAALVAAGRGSVRFEAAGKIDLVFAAEDAVVEDLVVEDEVNVV